MCRFIISLHLVLALHPSIACINYYHGVDEKGNLHGIDSLMIRFDMNFSPVTLERDLLQLQDALNDDPTYKILSDFSVLLLKAGKTKEAITILETLYRHHPNEYQLAANLGTAYELNGQLEKALTMITKGFELNSESHKGSEWIHIEILKAKIHGFEKNKSILALNHEQLNDSVIRDQIILQLTERFPFISPPNEIMGNLLVDLGDCFAKTASIEHARALYSLASNYFQSSDERIPEKIKQMLILRRKHAQVRPTRLKIVGDNIKVSGIPYKRLLTNNNPHGKKIKWDQINHNPESLLSMLSLEVPIVESIQPKPDKAVEKPVPEGSDPEEGDNTLIYLVLLGILLIGLVILRKNRR